MDEGVVPWIDEERALFTEKKKKKKRRGPLLKKPIKKEEGEDTRTKKILFAYKSLEQFLYSGDWMLMPIFGKRAQWQKKPNNMKKGWRMKIAK